MTGTYKVIFKGELENPDTKEKLKPALCKIIGIPTEKGEQLFNGRSYAIKKGLAKEKADELYTKLKKYGIVCYLIEEVPLHDDVTSQKDNTPRDNGESSTTQDSNNCKTCGQALGAEEKLKATKGKIFESILLTFTVTCAVIYLFMTPYAKKLLNTFELTLVGEPNIDGFYCDTPKITNAAEIYGANALMRKYRGRNIKIEIYDHIDVNWSNRKTLLCSVLYKMTTNVPGEERTNRMMYEVYTDSSGKSYVEVLAME